jgi:hypothetical protein
MKILRFVRSSFRRKMKIEQRPSYSSSKELHSEESENASKSINLPMEVDLFNLSVAELGDTAR